jgi:hypothetical protein
MTLGMIIRGIGYSTIHPVIYPLISARISIDNRWKISGMWGSAPKLGDASAPFVVSGPSPLTS